jgi:uncharacterized repeat protein (TIGR03803 family)
MDAKGNLYGIAETGGNLSDCQGGGGCGVVFKLSSRGREIVLYSFTGTADGVFPFSALIRDANGNFYGTTLHGGASGYGVVFKLDTTGKETVLHSFAGGQPQAPLIISDYYGRKGISLWHHLQRRYLGSRSSVQGE